MAAEWMGWENVFQVEIDKYCTKVLEKNFPNTKRYGDIKEFDGTKYRGRIDILTGGFPCQPFSVAGKGKGKDDNRYLWPEMLRVIREIQPPFIVGENVPGIIKLALEDICVTLEGEGYAIQPFIIPSASIGAWDKRDRVWIIAYNGLFGQAINEKQTMGGEQCNKKSADITESGIRGLPLQQRGQNKTGDINSDGEIKINPDTDCINSNNAGYNSGTISQQQTPRVQINSDPYSKGMEGHAWHEFTKRQKEAFRRNRQTTWLRNWIEVASELCGSNARVSHRMDRIKGLGNSVNPYVVFQIFKAIEQINEID